MKSGFDYRKQKRLLTISSEPPVPRTNINVNATTKYAKQHTHAERDDQKNMKIEKYAMVARIKR